MSSRSARSTRGKQKTFSVGSRGKCGAAGLGAFVYALRNSIGFPVRAES
jgi:hypothetical protein